MAGLASGETALRLVRRLDQLLVALAAGERSLDFVVNRLVASVACCRTALDPRTMALQDRLGCRQRMLVAAHRNQNAAVAQIVAVCAAMRVAEIDLLTADAAPVQLLDSLLCLGHAVEQAKNCIVHSTAPLSTRADHKQHYVPYQQRHRKECAAIQR